MISVKINTLQKKYGTFLKEAETSYIIEVNWKIPELERGENPLVEMRAINSIPQIGELFRVVVIRGNRAHNTFFFSNRQHNLLIYH